MNTHHLEIFYHVARNRGIAEAVRKFPYGIQQPAVSAQVLQLEQSLGTKLFQRQPFRLTPAGEKLFAFIEPFFSNVDKVAKEIQAHSSQFVRIGASAPVLSHHLPLVLERVRKSVPDLRLSLLDSTTPELIEFLKRDEIDMAVTTLPGAPHSGIKSCPLIELPLTLLVPRASRIRSADELWKRDTIDEPLICLPAHEPVMAIFQRGLQEFGVDWTPTLVVNSHDLVETYVAKGFGLGVTVIIPGMKGAAGIRRLPLPGFDSLVISALWA